MLALLAAGAWLVVDVGLGTAYSMPLGLYWNAGVRLVLYSLIVFLLAKLRERIEFEKMLARTDILTGARNSSPRA